MNNKYSNFLTILLVLIIIAIVAIIGFLGFKYYETYVTKNEAEDFVETYYGDTENNSNTGNNANNNNTTVTPPAEEENNENIFEGVNEGTNQNTGSSSSSNKEKYNGFVVAGSIEIPATNLKCPILDQSEYSPKALETAVVELYGPGLNQVGVTTIVGHNYRNGTFFSNNKKLNVGDRVFVTDSKGKRLSYTIYEKYEADESNTDFMVKDTQGAIEIALQTCTDDVSKRIIILAKADV